MMTSIKLNIYLPYSPQDMFLPVSNKMSLSYSQHTSPTRLPKIQLISTARIAFHQLGIHLHNDLQVPPKKLGCYGYPLHVHSGMQFGLVALGPSWCRTVTEDTQQHAHEATMRESSLHESCDVCLNNFSVPVGLRMEYCHKYAQPAETLCIGDEFVPLQVHCPASNTLYP
jgi:hypothetical protein